MTNKAILLTKLSAGSARAELVPRPRLAPCFDQAPFNRLTLVCAQAGYGKTTLISSWVHARADQVAWLSLDRNDNDAVRFLAHLVAAIRLGAPDFEAELARILCSPNPPPLASLMTGFTNALAALGQRLVLVLDDYHVVTESAVHDILLFLLEHQPLNLHIVIACREEPPFTLARLHSHGRLLRYSEADLCFTPDEAEHFFNRIMKLDLSQQQSDTLRGHTEGWVAGLQMAALSLAKGQDKAGFIAGFSGKERHVIDFLADEVLSSQSEAVQSFLMRTSILDRFNAALCEKLSGDADSQATLLQLERSHMFLIPLDSQREWYRYHHLFAELLQSRLSKAQPERLADLHRAAAEWLAANGMVADALRHAQQIQDLDLIARLLDRHAIDFFTLGQVATVAGWLKLLPQDVVLQYPRVALLAAFNTYFHPLPDVAYAERCLAAIDCAIVALPDNLQNSRDLLGKVAVVRGYQARYAGQAELSLSHFETARRQLAQDDLFYDIAMINLAILHAATGRLKDASTILRRYAEVNAARPHLWLAMTGIFGLSRIQFLRGDLHGAQEIAIEGLRQFASKGLQDMPVCSMLHMQLGEIAFLQNRLDEAEQQTQRALSLACAGGMQLNHAFSQILLERVKLARGQAAGLDSACEQRLLGFWAQASLIIPPLSGYLAQLWLKQGRVADLRAWFGQRGMDQHTIKPEWEMESLVLARLLLLEGRTGAARDLLNTLLANAERDQRDHVMIEILILQALVQQAEDSPTAAAAPLIQALALAQKSGQLRPFVEAGPEMELLLQKIATPAALAGFATQVLAAFRLPAAARQPAENRPAALSGKEEKVAHLLVTGLSNDEIANKLFVSPNTVKFHIKSLYRKLGVGKRFDAIQKLRGS